MKTGLRAFLMVFALLVAPIANASEQSFAQWLVELRQEAKDRGISDRVLDAALGNAAPIKRVIELDRRQPEFTMSFEEYLGKIASPTRARIAAKKLVEHDKILTEISKKYGVQKRYIVTFWG
ncbi:MAG: lytic murein transglycosylase, partial [Gammaproteobacteria bacterium]|nr:lytic murein transglycosylase [Gammaproteobacteria bacterium]